MNARIPVVLLGCLLVMLPVGARAQDAKRNDDGSITAQLAGTPLSLGTTLHSIGGRQLDESVR